MALQIENRICKLDVIYWREFGVLDLGLKEVTITQLM